MGTASKYMDQSSEDRDGEDWSLDRGSVTHGTDGTYEVLA